MTSSLPSSPIVSCFLGSNLHVLEYFEKDPQCLLYECAGDCDTDDDCDESVELLMMVVSTHTTYKSLMNFYITNTYISSSLSSC